MDFINYFLEEIPEISEKYYKLANQEAFDRAKSDYEDKIRLIPEHEWWKIEDIKVEKKSEEDLDYSKKLDILCTIIVEYLEKLDILICNKILHTIEKSISLVNSLDKEVIEVMFLEGILNCANSGKYYDYFYKNIGPETRKLVDRNNKFWGLVE